MEMFVKMAWGSLVLIHASPAAVLFMPGLATRLYGIDPQGDVAVLIAHRGALFLAVVAGCMFAAFNSNARPVMAIVTAISVLTFLGLYGRAGYPTGSLRTIALADLIALAPLALVLFESWRRQDA